MALTPTIQSTLTRHQTAINEALHTAIAKVAANTSDVELQPFYGQIQYHLGWVDNEFIPIANNPGKLLRPTLRMKRLVPGDLPQQTQITCAVLYQRLPPSNLRTILPLFTMTLKMGISRDGTARHSGNCGVFHKL